jgi:hypothetical protein
MIQKIGRMCLYRPFLTNSDFFSEQDGGDRLEKPSTKIRHRNASAVYIDSRRLQTR